MVRKEEEMAKIRITQVKSIIGKPAVQKRTIEALGIRKLNKSVVHEATPQIMGMVSAVRHLVKVENI
jgi:large subunit ribosomal protein L30